MDVFLVFYSNEENELSMKSSSCSSMQSRPIMTDVNLGGFIAATRPKQFNVVIPTEHAYSHPVLHALPLDFET